MQKFSLFLCSFLQALGGLVGGLLISAASLLVAGRITLLLAELRDGSEAAASGITIAIGVLLVAQLFLSSALCTLLYLVCGLWTTQPHTEPMIFRWLVGSGAALALYILYCLAFMIPDEASGPHGVTAADFVTPGIAACGVVCALVIFTRYVRPRFVAAKQV